MPVANLLQISEPVFVLQGGLVPADAATPGEGAWLVVAPDTLDGYPEEAREVLRYFSIPRTLSDLGSNLGRWGATSTDDVNELVDAGVVRRIDPEGPGNVLAQLSGMSVWLTASVAERQPSQKSVAFAVQPDRIVLISPESATAFSRTDQSETLAEGVTRAATELDVSEDRVWTRVGVDLVRVLAAGVGYVTKRQVAE